MRDLTNAMPSRAQSLLIMFLICVGLPTPVMGQSAVKVDDRQPDFPGLDIQAVVGWDGRVEVDAPVPVSFLISNQSSEVLEGQMILSDPETDREINLGDVFVGPGSVRRFSSVVALSDWSDCVAIYTDGSTDFWTRQLPLMTGKDFSEDVNFLLYVDDGGRALQLPVPADAADIATGMSEPAGSESAADRFSPRLGSGLDVMPVLVKSWQVPQHPGPLTVGQAMVFSETAKVDMLNDPQWDAIGRWVCLGGTVFVSEASKEVVERLRKAVPLRALPSVVVDEHQVSRCGGGSIREYSGQLFAANNKKPIQTLLEAASKLSRYDVLSIPDDLPRAFDGASNSNYTRLLVLAVFSIYLLFSGVVTLLLFRSNRRQVLTYLVSVVSVACLAAALLGSYLRNSRGDLHWQSITLGSPGGAVQMAQIQLQSAGGRNTRVAVRGKNVDLQLLRKDATNRDNYYNRFMYFDSGSASNSSGYDPFTVQSNLLKDDANAFRIGVPITPWGVRESVASAFDAEFQGVDLDLEFRSDGQASGTLDGNSGDTWVYTVPGQWTIDATNKLPFALTECRLVLTTSVPQLSSDSNGASFGANSMSLQFEVGRAEIRIADLPRSGTTSGREVTASFIVTRHNSWRREQQTIEPEPAFPGATDLWLVARVADSPMLKIDEDFGDFEHHGGVHYYMQPVPQEEIPQEWRDACRQAFEQQLNVAQEQLRVQKTQQPQNPQF